MHVKHELKTSTPNLKIVKFFHKRDNYLLKGFVQKFSAAKKSKRNFLIYFLKFFIS